MSKTSIEWTGKTWNPTTGCNKLSAGCKYCYAEILSERLQAMGHEKYKDGFALRMHEDALALPYTWKQPEMVFVNSMSDLFHKDVTVDFIKKVFYVMAANPQHTFQVLTKRADRLKELHEQLNWTPNIWMGVSVEDSRVLHRVDDLREINAMTKFLSCEPLIGPLTGLDLTNIDWVIVGGESGKKARLIDPNWVVEIHKNCVAAGVPFFFKQWGGKNKKKNGRLLYGRHFDEMPERKSMPVTPVNPLRALSQNPTVF
ncbi:phage Gp37/Gp68 family protein [Nemorincola caseinilytica]|uniref:Phage Gp37/Gp68 family protein n=1 Tax=Nemorincola caseinilytica TaxID=2054315 RepID=A0ABP8NE01_9BACT